MLIGGSPCQDFSTLGKRKGLNGKKSVLVNEYIKAFEIIKPKYFLLENNSCMPYESEKYISDSLRVEPIRINSKQFSLQNRDRLYWTNIPNVKIDNIKCVNNFDDILKHRNKINIVDWSKPRIDIIKQKYGEIPHCFNIYNKSKITDTFPCLTASGGNSQTKSSSIIIFENGNFYMINSTGWEKLQTLPIGYTKALKEGKRKGVIGNGWTVDVIAHILSYIPKEKTPLTATNS